MNTDPSMDPDKKMNFYEMDDFCFACGKSNRNGLRLRIVERGDGVVARIRLPGWAQGYEKIVHGGIVSTILDEMAVWAAYKKGYRSVTGSLNIRIRQAMRVDEEYEAFGTVTAVKYRLIQASARILDKDEQVVALADVKLIRM
jgi:acyl-coenzyme A thioesterase PaaI-like protein